MIRSKINKSNENEIIKKTKFIWVNATFLNNYQKAISNKLFSYFVTSPIGFKYELGWPNSDILMNPDLKELRNAYLS